LAKKRIIKDYDALTPEILEHVKLKYPTGYADHLISYSDREGKKVSALPFETEDAYYLIRMTIIEAKRLVKDEEDLEEDIALKDEMSGVEVGDEFDGEGEDDDIDDNVSDEDDHIIVTRRRDDGDDIADDSEY
jgi:DNA-directed RNA polymerase subunit delta